MAIFNMIGGGTSLTGKFDFEPWFSGEKDCGSTSAETLSFFHSAPVGEDNLEFGQLYAIVIERVNGRTDGHYVTSEVVFFVRNRYRNSGSTSHSIVLSNCGYWNVIGWDSSAEYHGASVSITSFNDTSGTLRTEEFSVSCRNYPGSSTSAIGYFSGLYKYDVYKLNLN